VPHAQHVCSPVQHSGTFPQPQHKQGTNRHSAFQQQQTHEQKKHA
jgi:hypothetical protein